MKRNRFWGKMTVIYILIIASMLGVAFFASDVITTMSESAAFTERKIIVIDAGHGGIDGGATSTSGVLESKTNLEIALRLRDLCNLLGIKTVMIRTDDRSIHTAGDTIAAQKVSDLKERVRIVNENADCILVSIHQNYFHESQYRGAQVFYNTEGDSKELAVEMQSALVRSLNEGSNRKSKKADGIYLMKQCKTTAILIECGFISNKQEDELLQSKEYQQKLCVVMASVLSSHLNA